MNSILASRRDERRRVTGRVALATALAAAALVVAPSSPAHGLGYEFRAEHSNKCLDVTGISRAAGAPLQQWPCLGINQQNQWFEAVRIFDGGTAATRYYELRPLHNRGMCLDVTGVSHALGARIQQWPCLGPNQHNQHFRLDPATETGKFKFRIVARHSQQCLDVINVSTLNGVRIQQWHCILGQRNQLF